MLVIYLLFFLTVRSAGSRSVHKDRQCGAVCCNMYKHCGGWCNRKRHHLKPHLCHRCRFTWSLSLEELAQALSQRKA